MRRTDGITISQIMANVKLLCIPTHSMGTRDTQKSKPDRLPYALPFQHFTPDSKRQTPSTTQNPQSTSTGNKTQRGEMSCNLNKERGAHSGRPTRKNSWLADIQSVSVRASPWYCIPKNQRRACFINIAVK